ncbi:hypothetical protein Tco_1357818 [Tanacetum coccineum]
MKKEKINITSDNYSKLNKLAGDFGKRCVPQQELSAEQKFWLQSSDKNSEKPSTSNKPVKIEVPSELPKSTVLFDKGLHDEIIEVKTVFTQMEAVVEQCSIDRKCCEIQQKQFLIVNDRLLDQIISQDIMHIVVNSFVVMCDFVKKNDDAIDICNKCLELEVELAKKNGVYGKCIFESSNLRKVSKPNATTIALGMYKLDLEPLAPKLLKNKDAHLDYIKAPLGELGGTLFGK